MDIKINSITQSNCENWRPILSEGKSVLYGAGSSGRKLLAVLRGVDIPVCFFVDDDTSKQGTIIDGIECISYDALGMLCQSNKVHVIISSLYAKAIIQKLQYLNVSLYDCFDWMTDENKNELDTLKLRRYSLDEWETAWENILGFLADEESLEIWRVLHGLVTTNQIDRNAFFSISSSEDHYFVKPIPLLLGEGSVLVDCGAYTGDMLGQIQQLGMSFRQLYAIEANPDVYAVLENNISKLGLKDKVIPLNLGVYDNKGTMDFSMEEMLDSGGRISTRGTHGARHTRITVDKLDHIIKEKIDFLKTDLEGADLPALKGAVSLLTWSRPILAVSIYHSFEDLVDIPLFLYELLPRYRFFLRHHSFTVGETVLYGIPLERERA